LLDGEFYGNRSVKVFEFNKSYYESNDFYGILSQAKLYSNMYQRQLKDLYDIYIEAIQLVNKELKISS
jgi:RNAse (barnase) inhibitor barstar